MMTLKLKATPFTRVSDIVIPEIFYRRYKTGIKEFDEMFGDGILPGSAFTVTAQAGCGKTTLLLQLMESLAKNGYEVGYASGEENQYQLAFNCKRLGVKSVSIANETDIDILAEAMKGLDCVVVDSFQALTTRKKMNSRELERYAVTTLINAAKENECTLFFIMHLTKTGDLKGSTLVPHAVDVNVKLERNKDGDDSERIISIYKNRFGPTQDYNAVMTAKGFELSGKREVVSAPSKAAAKKQLHSKIMSMDPPNITKKRLINELKLTSSQAYLALKELTEMEMLKKFGRGDSAVWKKVKVDVKEGINK
jgi:predicted ATP-dependent serine protease